MKEIKIILYHIECGDIDIFLSERPQISLGDDIVYVLPDQSRISKSLVDEIKAYPEHYKKLTTTTQ